MKLTISKAICVLSDFQTRLFGRGWDNRAAIEHIMDIYMVLYIPAQHMLLNLADNQRYSPNQRNAIAQERSKEAQHSHKTLVKMYRIFTKVKPAIYHGGQDTR